jgi:hypothetical protein
LHYEESRKSTFNISGNLSHKKGSLIPQKSALPAPPSLEPRFDDHRIHTLREDTPYGLFQQPFDGHIAKEASRIQDLTPSESHPRSSNSYSNPIHTSSNSNNASPAATIPSGNQSKEPRKASSLNDGPNPSPHSPELLRTGYDESNHQSTRKRRRVTKGPVRGNNPFGRRGTPRCAPCRKRHIKVLLFWRTEKLIHTVRF